MRKITYLLTLFIVCVSIAYANAQGPTLEKSLLWKISGNGITKPSYLFGTIHLMCEQDFNIAPKLKTALSASSKLMLEVDLSDPEEMKVMQKLMFSEVPLSKKLSAQQSQHLDSLLHANLKLSLAQLDQYSLTTIFSMLLLQSVDCPQKKMYEFELVKMAKEQKKPMGGLEKIAVQLDFLEKAYPTDVMLKQFDLFPEFKTCFTQMVKAYKEEDLMALQSLMMDKRFMTEETTTWLLTHRNKNWAEQIPKMIKEQSILFAVGSGHLPGENGVINLLRKKGYKVTPVFN